MKTIPAHSAKITCNSQGRSQPEQARMIAASLGFRAAAVYLRNRDWSIEAALALLVYNAPLHATHYTAVRSVEK